MEAKPKEFINEVVAAVCAHGGIQMLLAEGVSLEFRDAGFGVTVVLQKYSKVNTYRLARIFHQGEIVRRRDYPHLWENLLNILVEDWEKGVRASS